MNQTTIEDIRNYLAQFNQGSPWTYKNVLSAMKVFFRDFLRADELSTFKFPRPSFVPKRVPTKAQLRRFYECLNHPLDKAMFLIYATSGLRRNEVLGLRLEDVDLSKRMITPGAHGGRTKQAWVSFYNEEAARALEEWLNQRGDLNEDPRIFPVSKSELDRRWQDASERAGIKITPQVLREWFTCELGELGVPDRYIDAFCGRTARSVLARHYTDYSPERLKRIYDRAGLKLGLYAPKSHEEIGQN